jgi:hypothetical protein
VHTDLCHTAVGRIAQLIDDESEGGTVYGSCYASEMTDRFRWVAAQCMGQVVVWLFVQDQDTSVNCWVSWHAICILITSILRLGTAD